MSAASGNMMSNVGNKQMYESHEQVHSKGAMGAPPKFEKTGGTEVDQLNRVGEQGATMDEALRRGAEGQERDRPINAQLEQSKTVPSRGAEVDAELMREDQEAASKKGSFGPNV